MGLAREIPIKGRKYNISTCVDEEDYQTLRLWEYTFYRVMGRSTTYVWVRKDGKSQYLHRLIMGLLGAPKSVFVDHIDGNGLNNYRTNLQITNNSRNQSKQERKLLGLTTSAYKGVTKKKGIKPWKAYLNLGSYETEEEAARAYKTAEQALKNTGLLEYLDL